MNPALTWPDPLPECPPIGLRPWSDDDLSLIEAYAADPYIPVIGTVPAVFTPEAGREFVARQHRRLVEGTGWSVVFVRIADGVAVGSGGLWLHPQTPERATAGYVVAPDFRGRGYARAGLAALTTLARGWPELERVELLIEPGNAGSIAVAEAAGYRREALLPRELVIAGEQRDAWRYGVEVAVGRG